MKKVMVILLLIIISLTACSTNEPTEIVVKYGARMISNYSQNITSAVQIPVIFSTVVYDDSNYSSSSNMSRLTVNSAGKYLVGGAVQMYLDGSVLSDLQVSLAINGVSASNIYSANRQVSAYSGIIEVSSVVKLNAGDYVCILAFQDSGYKSHLTSSFNYTNTIWIQKVGE